jgi:hypothetical protein
VAWDEEWLRPRFIYEAEPAQHERELVSLFGTYLVADFSSHKVHEGWEVVPPDRTRELRPAEVWVYLRYEPEDDG